MPKKEKKEMPTVKTATTEQLLMELNQRWNDLITTQNAITEILQETRQRMAKPKSE